MIRSPVPLDGIDEIIAHVRQRFAAKPKVAFAGFGNSGKSSLLNAIYGSEVARVSMRTDETAGPQVAERFGIDFTDTPGMGTSKFSLPNVLDLGVLQRQHIVVHVLNGASAISSEDEILHTALRGGGARAITVVNKIDLLDERERGQYLESVFDKLGLRESEVLLVSAKRGTGIPELAKRIADLLPSVLQDAFIAQQQADETLKEKRVRALIYSKAGVCAAIAVAPLPIADILVLTPIQMAMVATIGYLRGVEVTTSRATELMGVMGAGVGLRGAARQLVRLVPGYGMLVSAAIAFAGTVALGESANSWFKRKMKVDGQELKELFTKSAKRANLEYAKEHAPVPGGDCPASANTNDGEGNGDVDVDLDVADRRRHQLRKQLEQRSISQAEFDEANAALDADKVD
jgi:GTP-binding protein Era